MFKKYKIKKRKKFISPYYIFILFVIAVLFVSTGYAYLSDTLTISGKANFLEPGGLVYGDSTYSWLHASTWGDAEQTYFVYAMEITIVNLDDDYRSDKPIVLTFEVPDGCYYDESTNLNVWQAESISFENNVFTLTFSLNGSWVPLGESLKIYPHLYFNKSTTPTISNLTIGGKYAKLEETSSTSVHY